MEKAEYTTIDEYVASFPDTVRRLLNLVRAAIIEAAPEAEESISYRMPAFRMNKKVLVYFGGFKDHIGFFPTSSGVSAFKDELAGYRTSKGTVRFPFDEDIPADLIKKIVKFRVNEVASR